MKNLENIAEDLFNKIRGRFPSVTIGSDEGKVTNIPTEARYYDFEYKEGGRSLGKVSVSLDEKSISVMYSNDFVANEDQMTQDNWYNFLKELRQFSKKRLLNFDTRNITKSNLDRRDYKFLALTRTGEDQMTESTMYGTSRSSFQNIGSARVSIKHNAPVNQENAVDRTRHISAIYVENNDGEKFKYPYKHLTGARAMARHVAEGGAPYDDFGTHIVSMSEELSKLRKFKTYMGRSSVMAEGLDGYVEAVSERMATIRKSLKSLQRENYYKETFEAFEKPMMEEVPTDVAENWIDNLLFRQFNEELADVFPYIYKLVSEVNKAKELGPEDLLGEDEQAMPDPSDDDMDIRHKGNMDNVRGPAGTVKIRAGMTIFGIAKALNHQNNMGGDVQAFVKDILDYNKITDPTAIQVGQVIKIPYSMGTGPSGASRGMPPMGFTAYEDEIESAFEELMGQFSETTCEDCGNQSWTTLGMTEEEIEEGEQHGNSKIYDKCWKGYSRVPGTTAGEPGSCKKNEGDEIDRPDGEKIKLEKDEQKTPLGEFILSYFDYTTGQFPKGETAILTMVEKDYGEHFIEPAKQFLEKINNRVSEVMGYREEEMESTEAPVEESLDDEFAPERVKASTIQTLVKINDRMKGNTKKGSPDYEKLTFDLGQKIHDLDMAGYSYEIEPIEQLFNAMDNGEDTVTMDMLKKAYNTVINLPEKTNAEEEVDNTLDVSQTDLYRLAGL